MEGGVVFDIYGAATVCEVGDFGDVYHTANKSLIVCCCSFPIIKSQIKL